MQTEQLFAKHKPLIVGVWLVVLAAVILVGLLLREYGPGNMGNGFLVGGFIGILLAGFAIWRVSRRPQRATTFERAFTQTGDERESAVLTRALAVMGLASFLLTCAAIVAVAFGGPIEVVLGVLLIAELLTGAVAFFVINRRI